MRPIIPFDDERAADRDRQRQHLWPGRQRLDAQDVGRAHPGWPARLQQRRPSTINQPFTVFPGTPFGGYKQSGWGRENGPYGIEEFLQTKSLQL